MAVVTYSISPRQMDVVRKKFFEIGAQHWGEWTYHYVPNTIQLNGDANSTEVRNWTADVIKFLKGEKNEWWGDAPAEQPNIAEKATGLVCGDRNAQYGHPGEDYARTCGVWNGLLVHKLKPGEVITAREAMLMMAAMKISREFGNPKEDSRIDAIGYILCEDWEVTGKKPSLSRQPDKYVELGPQG